MLRRIACCLVLLASACAPAITAIAVGPEQPPLPPDCEAREAILTPKDAEDHYRQVGVVCWSHGAREELYAAACQLGGTIVVRTGLCVNGHDRYTEQGSEYGVYTSSR